MRRTDGPRRAGTLALLPVVLIAADVERSSDVAARRLSLSVWGLLGLAGLIAVGTVVFWMLTRPERRREPAVPLNWLSASADGDGTPVARYPGFSTDARTESRDPVLPPLTRPEPVHGATASPAAPGMALRPPVAPERAGNV